MKERKMEKSRESKKQRTLTDYFKELFTNKSFILKKKAFLYILLQKKINIQHVNNIYGGEFFKILLPHHELVKKLAAQ